MTRFARLNRYASAYLIVRVIRSRPRLFGCFAFAIAVWLIEPFSWRASTRFLIAWNAGVWSYLALAIWMMLGANHESMSRRASTQDEGRFSLLIFGCLAAAVSIGAILIELSQVKDVTGVPKALHVSLAGSTIISGWLFIHMMFALHYAHEYFTAKPNWTDSEPSYRGGLQFPSTALPDYSDFLYFSYIIGVASQTADVAISSRPMRHVSLAHSIISFFFNTTVLALTINIAAGLV